MIRPGEGCPREKNAIALSCDRQFGPRLHGRRDAHGGGDCEGLIAARTRAEKLLDDYIALVDPAVPLDSA